MEIVNVPINDLKEADYNPRQMTEKQVADLTASIREFGLVDPIIVNKHLDRMNVVVGGHQRLKIARSEGFKDIPVVYVDLSLEQEKKLNLRLNRNNGEWNWETLANNFSIEELMEVGFDKKDLNFFDLTEDDFNEEEELAKIVDVRVNHGDMFTLGNHRVLCGDSTKVEDWNKLMGEDKAHLVYTDPPYMVNYDYYDFRGRKKNENGDGNIFDDDLSKDDAIEFYAKVLDNLYQFSTDDASIYWWYADRNYVMNNDAFKKSKWRISQTIIWLKERFIFARGQDYHRRWEPVFFGWKDGQVHYKNRKYSNYEDCMSMEKDDFEALFDVWYFKRDPSNTYIHPTQKPVRLSERALKKNSETGDIVIDAFGGSGSTLIGCEQSGRSARIMELDPKYAHAILKRWAKHTGKDPIREDGMAWSEIVK